MAAFGGLLGRFDGEAAKQPGLHDNCIPEQIGPPSPYAKRILVWMYFILLSQAVCCAMRFVVLYDMMGGLHLFLVVVMGLWVLYQDMHISYMYVWGWTCLLNAIFQIIGTVVPLTGPWAVSVQPLSLIVLVVTPVTSLLGALFAWHICRDYHQYMSDLQSKEGLADTRQGRSWFATLWGAEQPAYGQSAYGTAAYGQSAYGQSAGGSAGGSAGQFPDRAAGAAAGYSAKGESWPGYGAAGNRRAQNDCC